jgi:TPR repeat protein
MRSFGLVALLGVSLVTHPGAAQLQTPAALEQACVAGDAAACTRLGESYEFAMGPFNRGRDPDQKAAVPFYERACNGGHGQGCWRLAAIYEKGPAALRDFAKAGDFYGKACDAAYAQGCGDLAGMYEKGTGVAVDPERTKTLHARAVSLVVAACDRGDAEGCLRLGHVHNQGWYGLAKNPAEALRAFDRACTLGEPIGCDQASGLLSQGASGVARDSARAQQLHARSRDLVVSRCDAGNVDACTSLMTPIGDYKACLAGEPDACWRVGRNYVPEHAESPGDYSRALHFFLMSCEIDAEHCHPAAEILAEGRSGVKADPARAIELFTRACDAGDGGSCQELATRYRSGAGVTRDPVRAAALYQRVCDLDPGSCTEFANLLMRGEGVERNPGRAVKLFEEPCRLRDSDACVQIGLAYRDGNGVPRDTAAALKQLGDICRFETAAGCREACDLGDGEACMRAASKIESGSTGPSNAADADALYERAAQLLEGECSRGTRESCNAMSRLFAQVKPLLFKNAALALRFYTRLCEAEPGEACHRAAGIHDRGEGVPVNRTRAAALYVQGCEGGQLESCVRGAEIYRLGQGVAVDLRRAAYLTERADEIRRFRR